MELYPIKLLAGTHIGPDYKAKPTTEVVTHPVTGEKTDKTVYPMKQFNRGDVFYDKKDLTTEEPARYGAVEGPRRRETVKVDAPSEPAATKPGVPTKAETKDADAKAEAALRAELEGMTVPELKDHAKGMDVPLHGASNKADIIDAIVAGVGKNEDGE